MKLKWTILGILMLMAVANATAQVNITGHVAYVCNADNGTGTVTFYSTAMTGFPQNYEVRIGSDPDYNANALIFSGSVSNSNFSFTQSTSLTVGHYIRIRVTSGSFTDTKNFLIARFDTPDPPNITPLSAVICGSGSQLLTASGGSGTYQWFRNGSPVSGVGNTYTATLAGSYTVAETNYCGTSTESDPSLITVKTIPTKPSITPAGPIQLCDGASATLTAVGDATNTFTWYRDGNPTGQTGSSISVTLAGNYTVIESNTCGTSPSSDAVVVTTLNKPAAPTVTPAGPILLCDGGTQTLTANGTGGTYTWSTGATGSTLNVSTAGSYSVTESNSCGASVASNVVVVTTGTTPTQPSTPSVSPAGPIELCDGATTTLTASGGSGSYVWSNGANTASITVSTAGSYYVYSPGVTNSCGTAPNSANSNTVVVTTKNRPAAPSVTPAGPILLCNGNTQVLTANGTGGTYTWNTGATGNTLLVSGAGSYSVTETNSCGASVSSNVVVVTTGTIPTQPATPTVTPAGPILLCNGNTTTLTATGGSGSYIWSTGATTNSITVGAAGNYFVYSPGSTNACGTAPNSANSNTVVITTNSDPVVAPITGSNQVCVGSTINLSNITPGGLWNSSNNAVATVNSSGVVTGVSAGTVTISYAETNSCGTTTVTHVVTVNPLPVLAAIGGPSAVCFNSSVTQTNSTGGGVWSSSNTGVATINAGGVITTVAPGTTTITYTYTNGNGCTSSVQRTFTVHALPVLNISATVNSTSAVITVSGASSYIWGSGELTATISKPITSTATYTVTGTDGNGCDNTAQYAVNSTPNTGATSITSTLGTDFCQGSTATLTATAGNSYYWSTGATTQTITVGTSGTYTVFVARNATNIVEIANIVVTVSANTVGGTVSMDAAVCSGSNNGTLTLTGQIGDILRWEYSEDNGTSWTPLANTTTQQTYINLTTTTQYRAVIKSGTCPQLYSSVATITVKPTPSVNTVTNQILCNNDASTAITFTGSVPGTIYNWVNNTPSIGLAASGIGDIASFTAINTGNSPVTATITISPVAAGCPGPTGTFTIRVSPTPNVATVASQIRCAGELTNSITLTGTVIGTQFNWTNTDATIGLPASGMGSVISSFSTINTSKTSKEGIITVTASANGCTMVSQPETKAIAANLPVAGVGSNGNKYTLKAGTTTLAEYNKDASAITTMDVAQMLVSLVNGSTQSHGYSATSSGDIISLIAPAGSGSTVNGTAASLTWEGVTTITANSTFSGGIDGRGAVFGIRVNPIPSMPVISNQVLCNNEMTSAINMTSTVTGTLFNWTNSDASIGLAPTGSGSIASFTATNTGNSPVTATITISPVAAGCPGPTQTFTIRVSPTPNVAAVASQVRCAGEFTNTITLTGTVIGTQFNWTNTDATIGLPASGMGSVISSFSTINTGTTSKEGIITVTASANGCTMVSQSETKAIASNLSVAGVGSNGNKYTLKAGTTTLAVYSKDASAVTTTDVAQMLVSLVNGSTQSHGYSATSNGDIISLIAPAGSGSTVNGTAASLTWEGVTTITANSTFTGGIDGRGAVFGIRVNPIPSMPVISNQVLCNNEMTSAINMTSTVSGTLFNWTNDVVSIGLASVGTGNIASFQAINTSNSPITATVRVTPTANGCAGTMRTFTIRVNPTPGINTVTDQVLCNNAFTSAVNFSGPVAGTVYSWTNTTTSIGLGSTGTGNIASFRALNSGVTPVVSTIAVTASANGCTVISSTGTRAVSGNMSVSFEGQDGTIHRVRVGSTVIAEYTKLSTDLNPTDIATALVNQVNAGTGAHGYTAQNTGSIIRLTAPEGSGSSMNGIQAFVSWTGSYSITSSSNFNGGTDGTGTIFKIRVNPTPTVSPVSNQVVCNNGSTAHITLTGLVTGTNYTWTNNTPGIGLGVTGVGDIIPFSAVNLTNAPVTATIQAVPTANGCAGSTISFTIRVNPTPSVIAVSNLILCNRENTGNINFSGPVLGTTLAWTNNTTSIGLAASGTGNITGFMATNSSSDPVTATIRVTPTANSCTGPSGTFTIRVNPTPSVATQANQVVCNANNTAAVYFTGPVAGSTFDWTNDLTSIGLAAAGTGNIIPFAAINLGSAPVTANIRIVPTANGCIGTPSGFTIRVNPTPNVVAVASQVVCNKDLTTKVVFTGSVLGTAYTWTNDETYIGLSASGTGDINAFAGKNDSIIPITSNIRVTPSANSCIGPSGTFTIRVNPTPVVQQVSNIILCNDAINGTVVFNGPVSGTTYSWRNTVPSIGVPATGSGNISSFRALNDTTMPIIDSVYVVPRANNCTGKEMNFTIRVNPTPKLSTTLTPAAICDSTGFVYIPLSKVTAATFSWSRAAIPGIANAAASGNGSISEVLVNNSDDDITVVYTITITANGCSNIQEVKVVVRPRPKITQLTVTDVCDMSQFTYTIKPSVKSKLGSIIRWVRPQISGISNTAAIGNSEEISEYLNNTTALPVKVKYIITLTLPGGCDHTDTLQLTVNPTPRLTTPLVAQVCDSSTLNYVPESNVKSALFTWSRPAVQGIRNEAATGREKISEILYNDANLIRKVPYYLQNKDKGCTGYDTVWTTVVPRPFGLIEINPTDKVKSGEILKLKFVTTDTIGKKYNWQFGDNLSASTYLNPIEHFYNTTNSGDMALKLNITNTFGCTNSFTGSVYVVGDPTARPMDSIAVQRNYSMAAFPVPFTSDLRLKYSLRGPDEKAMYYVNDVAGRIIYAVQITLPGGDQVIKLPSDRLYGGIVYTLRIKSKTFDYESKVYKK